MNHCARLADAYPPLAGEPRRAAPLEITTRCAPGFIGKSSALRNHTKADFVSMCQLCEKLSHVWRWIARCGGIAPAASTTRSGAWSAMSLPASTSSAASPTTISHFVSRAAASSCARSRATAITRMPRPTNASTTPRPRPRLPPVTIAVFVIASSVSPVRAEHVLRELDVSLAADEDRHVLATDD